MMLLSEHISMADRLLYRLIAESVRESRFTKAEKKLRLEKIKKSATTK